MSLIVYTGAFRFPCGDAAAARVLNNAKILRELGYDVLFLSWGGAPRIEDKNGVDEYYYEGFRYINTYDLRSQKINLFKRIYNYILLGRKSLRIIREINIRPSIIIAYNPSLYISWKLMSFCRRKKIALVSDLTEWYAPQEFPGNVFAPPVWLNEFNMRVVQKRVKNKFVISRFLDHYYAQTHNLVLPPLVDKKETKWQINGDQLSLMNLADSTFSPLKLIYAGNPARKDLLSVMLKAILSMLDRGYALQFRIVGVSADDLKQYYNIEGDGKYKDAILPLGRISQEKIPAYYAISDFSLIIRNRNRKTMAGFPTKLAESIMGGCPVICNATSDISEYVRTGFNGYVLETPSLGELESVLSSIVQLSADEIKMMKGNAKKCASVKFDYYSYIDPMKIFLNNLKY